MFSSLKYEEFRSGSWDGAANGIIQKLKDMGVRHGQVISIDAHKNDISNEGQAIFSAQYCLDLPDKGPLGIKFKSQNAA